MTSDDGRHRVHLAIVGAGFAGIGAAIRLKRRGYHDFVVFERGDEVGGTWRDNSYPGCACDVPSHLYSLSFVPNPDWSRSYSSQPEIWSYQRRCVEEGGLAPHLRLGHEVYGATWDDAGGCWLVDTSGGGYRADFLIVASGAFNRPSIPRLPGLAEFAGEVFHSARWNHRHDLTGRRVAVVGTGASAIQFVPRIAPAVRRLHLFQRTAPWVRPRHDRAIGGRARRLFRALPSAQRAARAASYWKRELAFAPAFLNPALMRAGQVMALRHLRATIADPGLRAAVTPTYTMGCKRILVSDDYYPALLRDNVELVTAGIAEVRPDSIVTRDGTVHEVDTIIFGTGFHVTELPLAATIRGGDGRSLAEHWQGSMRAYRGSTVAGFPNLFLLPGPNTGLGHSSILFMIECQLDYLFGLLRHVDRTGIRAIEPTRRAQDAFVSRVDRRMARTVWSRGGCQSWYVDATGRNSTIWPGYTWSYWLRTRRFDPAAYRSVPAQRAGDGVPVERAGDAPADGARRQ